MERSTASFCMRARWRSTSSLAALTCRTSSLYLDLRSLRGTKVGAATGRASSGVCAALPGTGAALTSAAGDRCRRRSSFG
eukprot:12864667-Alexandrium_andersonii.AAC.1